jgi:tetratricopeptide (TPR) repeat protein
MPKVAWREAIHWLAVLGLLFGGCKRQPQQAQNASQPSAPANYFQTHFQDEAQFVVETVLVDLAEMAGYAQNKPPEVSVTATEQPGSQFRQPSYDVKIVSGKQVLEKPLLVSGPIWSPELYEPFARALGAAKSTPNQHDANDLSVLLALADLQPSIIEAQNQKVSGLLQTNFHDAVLHEKAAVILGAFALREFSDDFYDIRSVLCRMTAHLALVKAFSGQASPGINGRVAEVMLFTLMNNQKAALDKLAGLEGEPKLKPWVNALRARNTYDYRPLQEAKDPSRLESIMFYYAISRSINHDAGWEQVGDVVTNCTDFARMAFGDRYSVGLGHVLHAISLPLEFAEINEVHSLVTGTKLSDSDEMIKFLNQMPDRCFPGGSNAVRIIGPGQWGMFLQRHLCHVLRHNFTFLNSKWSVKEEAKEFAAVSSKQFARLRLYPFVRRHNAINESEYHRSVDEGQPVVLATPHLVSAENWNYLSSPTRFKTQYWPGSHPHVNEWHKHNPLPGTVYDPGPRIYHPSLVNRADTVKVLEQLHEMAPYEEVIANKLVERKYAGKDTFEQAEKIFHPVLAYSARQNLHLAKHSGSNPARYEELMLRYAKLNPEGYFTLGSYFAAREQAEKAAGYYEKGIELVTDDVMKSNECGWLVRYYFDKGQREKAEALADQAAEVYSGRGLCTKAQLMELEKKYDEALDYYQRNEERYNDPGPLAAFCVRYKDKTGDSRFDKLVKPRLKSLFPRGVEKVGLKEFKAAPEEGVLLSGDSDSLKQAGLKKGDVIVGLDGMRVYDAIQYMYVRSLGETNAEMNLIVWNGAGFVEKKANPPNRRFGVPIADYRAPAKP